MDSSQRFSPHRVKLIPAKQSTNRLPSTRFSLPPWIWTPPNWTAAAAFEDVAVDRDARDHVVQADARGPALACRRECRSSGSSGSRRRGRADCRTCRSRPGRRTPGPRCGSRSARSGGRCPRSASRRTACRSKRLWAMRLPQPSRWTAGRVGALEPGDVGDGAVLDEVPAGRQGLAVAAGHCAPPQPSVCIVQPKMPWCWPPSTTMASPPSRRIVQPATRQSAAAADVNPVAPPFLERQSEEQSRARRPPSSRRAGRTTLRTVSAFDASTPSGGSQ